MTEQDWTKLGLPQDVGEAAQLLANRGRGHGIVLFHRTQYGADANRDLKLSLTRVLLEARGVSLVERSGSPGSIDDLIDELVKAAQRHSIIFQPSLPPTELAWRADRTKLRDKLQEAVQEFGSGVDPSWVSIRELVTGGIEHLLDALEKAALKAMRIDDSVTVPVPPYVPPNELHLPPEPEVGTTVEIAGRGSDGTRFRRFPVQKGLRDTHNPDGVAFSEHHRWGLVRRYRGDAEFDIPDEWCTWAMVWNHVVDSVWDEYDPHLRILPDPVLHKRGDTLTAAQAHQLTEGAVVRSIGAANFIALTRTSNDPPFSGSGWSPYPPNDAYTYELLAEGK